MNEEKQKNEGSGGLRNFTNSMEKNGDKLLKKIEGRKKRVEKKNYFGVKVKISKKNLRPKCKKNYNQNLIVLSPSVCLLFFLILSFVLHDCSGFCLAKFFFLQH